MTQPQEKYDPDSALHSWDEAVFVEDQPQAVTAALAAAPYHGAFCRNPLHPGPCKGWKRKQRSTSTGETAEEQQQRQRGAKRGKQPTSPPSAVPPKIVKANKEIGKPSRYGKVKEAVPAEQMEKDWAAHNATLTPDQQQSVRAYSGSSYDSMNSLLRGQVPPEDLEAYKKFYDEIGRQARNVQDSMAAAPRATKVFRGMRSDALGLGDDPSPEQILALADNVLVNDAFTSTTVNPEQSFSGNVQLEIDVPKGTPSLWVDGNSGIPSEQELLLAAGSKMRVESVEAEYRYGMTIYKVKGRIVP